MAVHFLGMLPKQTDKDIMDRKDSIKFKLMSDGVIRAHDSRYGCGISEWHIITPPPHICDTITTAQQHKLLIADETIYRTLHHAILRRP